MNERNLKNLPLSTIERWTKCTPSVEHLKKWMSIEVSLEQLRKLMGPARLEVYSRHYLSEGKLEKSSSET
jgi:hypothetical protein